MKIKITASRDEKIWSAIIGVILLTVLFIYNKRYLFILNVEFDYGVCSKLLLKVGFIFSKKIEISADPEKTVTMGTGIYGYVVNLIPLKDQYEVPTGQYDLVIEKGEKEYKKVRIERDEYYTHFMKTPLGKIE